MLIADPSDRLMRQRICLAEYKFEIHYKKGNQNNHADALSRFPTNGHTTKKEDTEPNCLIDDVTLEEEEEEEDTNSFI